MGFVIRINGEEVYETDVEASSITNLSVRTAQGEAAAVGSPYGNEWVDIVLTTITPAEQNSLASHVDAARARERADKTEELDADRVTEGRKLAEDEVNESNVEDTSAPSFMTQEEREGEEPQSSELTV